MTTRRRFIEIVPLAGVALLAACSDKAATPAAAPTAAPLPSPAPVPAPAAPPPAAANTATMDPAEPAAVALGYVTDATKTDSAKYKTYSVGQACSNCVLFAGKAGDASGPCSVFGGRPVSAAGRCSAYAKKAA